MAALPFRFSDPRHERIHSRLGRLIGPGAAAFFRDACKLVDDPTQFQSSSHVLGHLLRETEGSIRKAFQPLIRSTGPLSGGDDKHRAEIERTLRALGIPETDVVAKAWLAIAGNGNPKGLAAFAHRNALGPPRPFDAQSEESFERIVAVLDAVLEKVEERWEVFLTTFDALARRERPTAADATELRQRLPAGLQARTYFFSQLQIPAWVELLECEGFFRDPPDPIHDEDAGTITFPQWPESQYLIRMAQLRQAELQAQIVQIAEQFHDSENVSVYDDLVTLAVAVPAGLSVRLVRRIQSKLPLRYSSRFPLLVADLVGHLAAGNFCSEARDLARVLLAVDPDHKAERYEEPPPPGLVAPLPEPQPRMHPVIYDDCLARVVPALYTQDRRETILLLADLLEGAIRLSQRAARQAGPEAHSQVWWGDLRQPRPGVADQPTYLLLEALRDRLLDLAGGDPNSVPPLLGELERRPWYVFRRLALILLPVIPGLPLAEIEARLLRFEDHESLEVSGEYTRFLQRFYPRLSPAAQERIRDYLSRERELSELVENFRSWEGRDPTALEITRRQDEWRAARLRPIEAHLPPALRAQYDTWARSLVPESEPAPPPAGWWNARSPMSTEELAELSDEALIEFLGSAKLGDERFGPSREGLGQALVGAVAADPKRFARLAPRFGALDPAYQHGLFAGLQSTVTGNQPFPWDQVIDLAASITSSRPGTGARRGGGHAPDEAWVRRAILELVALGLQEGPSEIPFTLRGDVWRALRPVADDPDPTAAQDAENSSTEARESLYCNSLRPRSLDVVWAYTCWVYRHVHRGHPAHMTMAPIPEVQEVLERHLDSRFDPSPAVRVFYGMWWQQLRRLDPVWLAGQVERIFTRSSTLLRRAAWEAYLRSAEPTPADFSLLREIYEQATTDLGPETSGDDRRAATLMGRHLVRLQWLGILAAHDDGGVLSRYFERADARLCGETLAYVGHILHNTTEGVPPEILERMQALWEWRRAKAEAALDSARFSAEMAAFGWLFLCVLFEPTWSLRELEAALRVGSRVEVASSVVERLASLSQQFPKEAIDCLGLIAAGNDHASGPMYWLHHARPILEHGRRNADPATQQAAIALINRLSSLGYTEFRNLL